MTRLLAVLGVLGISFSAIFVRLAAVSPSTAAVFRTGYAVPFLLAGWLMTRNRDRRIARSRLLAVAAGFCLALDLALWHRSIAYIGAGLATVLANTQVVFVGLAAWLLHRERPSNEAFWTIPAVFGGVVLISGLGRPDAYGSQPLLGVVYGSLAGAAYSTFLLVFRSSNRALAPSIGPLLDATVGAFAGSLVLSLFDPHVDLSFRWPSHGWLFALALVAQVGGWLLISSALPRLPALDTSVLLLLQPSATVLWGLLIFNERLSLLQWTGVACVLGGVGFLSTRGGATIPRTIREEPER